MALHWTPTPKRRAALAALNLVAPFVSSRRRVKEGNDKSVKSVGVVELWNIGDAILLMPFLSALRQAYPGAKTVLIARQAVRELFEGTDLVDEFVPADLAWTGSSAGAPGLARRFLNLWSLSRTLGRRKLDVIFSARLHIREHALLMLSGAGRTVGFQFGSVRTPLTDLVAIDDPDRHKTDDWLALLAAVGKTPVRNTPHLVVSDSEQRRAKAFLREHGIGPEYAVVGIHPGASVAEKRWPIGGFRAVAEALLEQGAKVAVFVDPSGVGEELADVPGTVIVKVGLRELIAMIAECDVLVCNDSGPMHIAAAVGTRVVALFGTGIDRWYAPIGGEHTLLSPPPGSGVDLASGAIRSPAAIPTATVIDAISRVLRGSGQTTTLPLS